MTQGLMMVLMVGMLGGIAVGIQTPMANLMSVKLGVPESAFFVHLSGAVVAALPILLIHRGGQLKAWQDVPFYVLWAGAFGIIFVSSISYTIPRVGVAGGIILVIAGQLIMAVLIDHFGWLGVEVRHFQPSRLLGFGAMFLGIWLVIR